MELTQNDLGPCRPGRHKFVPIGEPHVTQGIVQRVVLLMFCQNCAGTTHLVLKEETPKAP